MSKRKSGLGIGTILFWLFIFGFVFDGFEKVDKWVDENAPALKRTVLSITADIKAELNTPSYVEPQAPTPEATEVKEIARESAPTPTPVSDTGIDTSITFVEMEKL